MRHLCMLTLIAVLLPLTLSAQVRDGGGDLPETGVLQSMYYQFFMRLFWVLSGRRSQIEFPTVEVDGVDEVLLIAETARRGLDPLNP